MQKTDLEKAWERGQALVNEEYKQKWAEIEGRQAARTAALEQRTAKEWAEAQVKLAVATSEETAISMAEAHAQGEAGELTEAQERTSARKLSLHDEEMDKKDELERERERERQSRLLWHERRLTPEELAQGLGPKHARTRAQKQISAGWNSYWASVPVWLRFVAFFGTLFILQVLLSK